MRLSVIIVTHNRAAALQRTLEVLQQPGRLPGDHEILVVDNGSTDGTGAQLAQHHPGVVVIALERNEGVSARNHAFKAARGRYVLLVDDDSYPLGDAVPRMLGYLDHHPQVGAVTGRIVLPDGRAEASALPTVIANGAVVLRRQALDELDGDVFPREFFRQAEEYDLSLRLWQAGWSVERFEDVEFRHEKVGGNRWPGWIHRLDLRNNLILLERYFPPELRREFRVDWTQRYTALAQHAGHGGAARRGWSQAWGWQMRYALAGGRRIMSPGALEAAWGFEMQARRISAWARQHHLQRVAIADFAKGIYVTWRGCAQAGLTVAAIVDNHPAYTGMTYRGAPIVADRAASTEACAGLVLANVNPAQVAVRAQALAQWFRGPVLTLWEERRLSDALTPLTQVA